MRSLADVGWPLRSPRLTIRPSTPDDVEATWRYRMLADVNHWITRAPATIDEYRTYFAEPDRLLKTLLVEYDTVVVGDLMVDVRDAWAQAEVAEQARSVEAELGWALDPAYGGKGLATEAVQALLRLCFADLGLRRVVANCFADNEASWRLMERVGMRREAHTRAESLHRSGRWLDGLSYAMLAEEWPDRP